jgi:hypothetical protein
MTTMNDIINSSNIQLQALKSRCLIIPFYPILEDLKKMARGGQYYNYEEIKIKEKTVLISKPCYNKILKHIEQRDIETKDYLRLIGDVCRTYAVLGKHSKDIYDLIIDIKLNAFKHEKNYYQ